MSSASASTAPASPRSASTGGWMPRTTERSSPSAALLVDRASAIIRCAVSGSVSIRLSAMPRLIDMRDQPGLRAVVEVALDPAQLGRGVVDGLGAGLGQPLHPLLEHLGVAVGQHPAVHVRARLHDRLDAVVPERPGHDQDQQQHGDQRDREPDGARDHQPARSRQVIGSSAQPVDLADRRRARCGGTGRGSASRARRPPSGGARWRSSDSSAPPRAGTAGRP